MLLTIDAGNTNCVFAIYDGEQQMGLWRASNDARRTADEYAVWLMQLMGLTGIRPQDIDAAIIASVVPASMYNLTTLCTRYFHTTPLVVGDPDVELGMRVLLDNPAEVGADRVVNAVAAHAVHQGALVVIDFGTATTFDVVNADGDYVGGIITPGVNLSMEALHMAASKLPQVAVRRPASVIGRGTIGAMQSGVFWGYVSMIEGLIARIRTELGVDDLRVIATGGLASLFANATDVIEVLDKDLTLRGLLEIHRRNQS